MALALPGWLVRHLIDPETVRAAIEQQASAALGQPVRVGAVAWALSARPRVVLTDVQIGAPAAVTLHRVEVTTGLRALLSRRVEGGGLEISGSRIVLPLPFTLGADTTKAPPASGDAGGLTIASIDRISLRDVVLSVGSAQVALDLESSLSGERLTVSRLRLRSARTTLEGTGNVTGLSAPTGQFTVTADPLDLDELLAIASGLTGSAPSTNDAPQRTPAAIDLRTTVTAPKGRLLGIDFTRLQATLQVTPRGVSLEPLGMSLLGGTLTGRAVVDTTRATAAMTLSMRVEAVDAAKAASLAGSPGLITGRLGAQVEATAEAGAPDVVFGTARGRATLTIDNGTLPYLDLIGPVIVAFGTSTAHTAWDRSNAFKTLGGTFAFADGVLHSEELSLTSRDLDVAAREFRLTQAAINMKADLVLSESLSAQAGSDLRKFAREGSRIVLPAKITGPIRSPKVSIDLGAAAGRAVSNAARDEVKKGLGRLFRR
ncbi:AsmA-like C-terminal region-containing protein [Luteitalea sp. TBR-22]|uniref:AsmA family protein n=1 Tax=Luteitalea sp. TBR-22 TaxID=2802971 RepID=UPI001EF6EAB7|nr:AsmA-like C-terminal region-containing protein [Luteitalea sp. TBR-22]